MCLEREREREREREIDIDIVRERERETQRNYPLNLDHGKRDTVLGAVLCGCIRGCGIHYHYAQTFQSTGVSYTPNTGTFPKHWHVP